MTDAPPPPFGLVPHDTIKTMAGVDFLRAMMRGELPLPPICEVLGFRPVVIDAGLAVFEGTPRAAFYNPLGTVHGGYAATLLDSAMGCAVHSTLKPGIGYTTLEFKINFVRPMNDTTGPVRAEARIIHAGTTIATSEGKLLDARSRIFAHATTTCLIFALP
jgi:uncharacterized protein (TIGR00369 family)